MDETSKCYKMRLDRGDFTNYLHGRGIDIGCGKDVLKLPIGYVQDWDRKHGDAKHMVGAHTDSYDFVYSSHCLEHLTDTRLALFNWTRILKPGGWLYLVVPDYELYEKCRWPSVFNPDHKCSFSARITRKHVNRKDHFHVDEDLLPMFKELGLGLEGVQVEDDWYDYNNGHDDQTKGNGLAQICIIAYKR